jgi:ATP-dependent Clp protease ATP-binding subunit ClpC
MLNGLTSAARNVLLLAANEARRMNHDFIGTEHILLGLLAQESDIVPDVLNKMGIDADNVRREVERLIHRGASPVTARVLPSTPRTRRVIQFAIEGASTFDQTCASTEHLLLGLVREPEGVAYQVLLNLGVNPDDLQARVLKIRIAQMKIVERAVRPLRAGTPRKRRLREELLSHLSAIYEQEQVRLHNPEAALDAAAQRFGDPDELARELDAGLPHHERISYFAERFMLYRAPESAAHYSLRMATYTGVLLIVILSLVVGGVFLRFGWTNDVKTLARVMAGITVLTPPALFAAWLAYIKMRDALWGVFGSRKSLGRVLILDCLIAGIATLYVMGVAAVARLDIGVALDAARLSGWMPVLSAIAVMILARMSGPTEIRDTIWALLDIRH